MSLHPFVAPPNSSPPSDLVMNFSRFEISLSRRLQTEEVAKTSSVSSSYSPQAVPAFWATHWEARPSDMTYPMLLPCLNSAIYLSKPIDAVES